MKLRQRLTIPIKISFSFGFITLSIFIATLIVQLVHRKDVDTMDTLYKNVVPSLATINLYADIVHKGRNLAKNWLIDSFDDTPKKKELRDIKNNQYPELKNKITDLSVNWTYKDRKLINEIIRKTDHFFSKCNQIMLNLNSFESYNNRLLVGKYKAELEEGNPLMQKVDEVLEELTTLRKVKDKKIKELYNDLQENNLRTKRIIIIMPIVLILIIISTAFFTAVSLIKSIRYITQNIKSMAEGKLPNKEIEHRENEVGDIIISINKLIRGLKEKIEFTQEIEKGNFNRHLYVEKYDILGNALIEMRNSLKKASQEAKLRRIENQQRTWSSQGIAKFNEIIRAYSNNAENFYTITISELTKYLNAQIGGLYIIEKNEELQDVRIELHGFYAFGREKFEQKFCKPGENLVGQCYLEKDTIYITDVPKGYAKISSGLGKDDPQCLLIVPLKLNDEVYGIVEIAALEPMEQYKIEFAEKTGEIIASTISAIKTNQKTALLLAESNEKSEKLAKQEEESRKAIQDLEKSQKALIKKEKEKEKKFTLIENEYKNEIRALKRNIKLSEENIENLEMQLSRYVDVLNNSAMVIETDLSRQILRTNKKFTQVAQISALEVSGKNIDKFIDPKRVNSKEYIEAWRSINEGKSVTLINNYFFKEQKMTFRDTYTPLQSGENTYYKVRTPLQRRGIDHPVLRTPLQRRGIDHPVLRTPLQRRGIFGVNSF